MINIPSDYTDVRLPRQAQLRRIERVIRDELTSAQREVLLAVYYGGKTQAQIAAERGVSRSTVCRTLHRAEARLRRFLRY
ncbi:MAG: sigma-70 family RNA polymerase sigma factor [Oscillospiraceae bacterium]|nr:sigma-70 family RNA polymerase sigma factor [Oscillospiraceae bacterium]